MISVIRRITNISGQHKHKLIFAYIISIFEAIAEKAPILMFLYALIKLVNRNFTRTDFYIILGVIFLSLIVGITFRYFKEKNTQGTGYMIFAEKRYQLGDHIKRFPMSYFTEGNIGNLSSVIASDIKFIEEHGMTQLTTISTALISVAVTFVMLTIFSFKVALIMFVICFIFAFLFHKLQIISSTESREMQETQKEMTTRVIEYIKGMEVVKAFHLVGEEQKRTNSIYRKMSDVQYNFEKKFITVYIVIESVLAIGTAVIIYVSSNEVMTGAMSLPMMLMLVVFSFEMFKPLSVLSKTSAEIRVMEACLDRYEKVVQDEELKDKNQMISIENYDVNLKDVCFSYEKKEVLQNISFCVKEKSMTALVGKSGCGKTTITNLMARFWDVDKGSITIGGADIRDMSYDLLASNISMVFQKVYLFKDSVYNNIAFGNNLANKEEVIEAAKKARCYDFIMKLNDGFDTLIGEAGATLSGGEKQRISIARAILKDAPIIILDEATASVDPDNEAYIQEAINELIANKTLIVIAHKLSTIKRADQIVVLNNGQIEKIGCHDELIQKNGLYKELWEKRQKSRSWQIKG